MSSSTSVLPTRFRYRLSPVNMRRGLWVVLGSFAVLLLVGELVSGDLFSEILEDLLNQPAWALALGSVASLALIVLIARIVSMAKDAWLVVDTEGIRCSPHKYHGPRTWLRHNWQLPWSAIERAVVRHPGPKAHHVQNWINTTLTLESAQGRHDLGLLHWDPVDDPLDRPDLMAMRPGKQLHALAETHPLVRHLEQRDIEVEFESLGLRGRWGMGKPAADRPNAKNDDAPVDLMQFKSLVLMLSLMGAIGVAAALHFMVLPPIRALWSPNYGLSVLLASLVLVAGALLASAAPVRERTIIALLLGLMSGLLFHPLSVRWQALTGPPAEPADYIVEAPGRFQPVDARHPAMDLSDLNIPEYWASLSAGDVQPFDLQTAGGDRYILRLDSLFERTRDFYGRREAQ
ncbi:MULTISPECIES: hypothetical protein [unclassified Wenzhouxiangella]|uniref:hypothetical protein n=1 Tax=unclassified Wenzhouxiangella TaxID=2613841 RepID=UPI000E32999B|nr:MULTISPECIES: hypothetical protein [unclassified Wenzhouxiangella]RFF27921.1 hypothetical protein DZK25_05475 [Wenzhouxiangella sp. 15181]RFP67202.1 hypothetical protein DZK26_13775 [Wenzhouxiangella sp. 15190]